jgi:serine/threonine protein kinase
VSEDTELLPLAEQRRNSSTSNHSNTDHKGLPVLARTALSVVYIDQNTKTVYKEANNKDSQEILSNEVRVLRALQKKDSHFDIIQPGSNQSKTNPLLVMRYVGSVSLDTALSAMSGNERMSIARSFVAEVEKIHTAGYTHRDLKPENIILNKTDIGGYVYASIIDFGLARPVGKSQEGFLGGTRPYMPNTQHDVGLNAHAAMDWYAVARVLIVLFNKFPIKALEAGLQDGKFVDIRFELVKAGYDSKATEAIGAFVEFATRYGSEKVENQNELSKQAKNIIKYI